MEPKKRIRKYRQKRRDKGLCIACPNPISIHSVSRCDDCLQHNRTEQHKYNSRRVFTNAGTGETTTSR